MHHPLRAPRSLERHPYMLLVFKHVSGHKMPFKPQKRSRRWRKNDGKTIHASTWASASAKKPPRISAGAARRGGRAGPSNLTPADFWDMYASQRRSIRRIPSKIADHSKAMVGSKGLVSLREVKSRSLEQHRLVQSELLTRAICSMQMVSTCTGGCLL